MLHISIYSALPKGKPFPKDRAPHFFLRLRFTFCLFYSIPTDLLPFPETICPDPIIRAQRTDPSQHAALVQLTNHTYGLQQPSTRIQIRPPLPHTSTAPVRSSSPTSRPGILGHSTTQHAAICQALRLRYVYSISTILYR